MNRKWLTLGMMFASGVAMGVAASWTYLENKANTKYRTWVELRVGTEDQLRRLQRDRPAQVPMPVATIKENLKADLAVNEELVAAYVPGHKHGEFEIINEDMYHTFGQEYDKITIEVYRDDLQYQLVMDGETVLDWTDILTPDVIEDLKGQSGIYLRNERKKEDYHVTWGTP